MRAALPIRKGWCPGALRPMPAKDGLLVRLRIGGRPLGPVVLQAVAGAGRRYGNGLFELTSRANLQLRGVSEGTLPYLLEDLGRFGLLDEEASGEAVRNVLVSPLAGLEAGIDVRPIAAALEAALVRDKGLHGLPGKFGFLIDDGGALSLDSVPADVRFRLSRPDRRFSVALGRTGEDSIAIGSCAPDDVAPVAVRLARAFLGLGAGLPVKPRRMTDLLRAVGPRAIAVESGLCVVPASGHPRFPRGAVEEPSAIGLLDLGDALSCFGAGAPFGRLETSMVEAAAEASQEFGAGEVRLTPWRALLFPGVDPSRIAGLERFLAARGFITRREDPRLAVAACGGMTCCSEASTDTRADALALADVARKLRKAGIALHVSGCPKGCARPAATPYTLVAAEGCYDLVIEGPSSGAPVATGLGLTRARDMLLSESSLSRATP